MQSEVLTLLKKKITAHKSVVGIIGLGYVGLPLMIRMAEVGFPVIGFDINENHRSLINEGMSPFINIPHEKVAQCMKQEVRLSGNYEDISLVDCIILCLPTPLNKHREPDLSYINSAIEAFKKYITPGTMVSLESTTWPGTTNEVLRPKLEEAGFIIGQNIALVYSPEREDPGNKQFQIQEIPKVVGGVTPNCLEVGEALYGRVVNEIVPVSSTEAAELTKLLENIQRMVNIGLMNEMKVIAKKMDINIFEVIDAAATKPFGFTPYYPGPGLGGHCIPIDPFYLTWKAREYGLHTRFIELAGEINHNIINFVIDGIVEELSYRFAKAINGARILVCGVAYKKGVSDVRESPALSIISRLMEKKCNVLYHDPFVLSIASYFPDHCAKTTNSVEITPELIKQQDVVVIITDHDEVDYEIIRKNAALIIDTRNTKALTHATNVAHY